MNRTPFTTSPSATSKQGMIRLVSMAEAMVSGARHDRLAEGADGGGEDGEAGDDKHRHNNSAEPLGSHVAPQPGTEHEPQRDGRQRGHAQHQNVARDLSHEGER